VQLQAPLRDADLVDLLARIRPRVRNKGGVSKALVRSALAQRFPRRGFESQRKSPSRLIFIQSIILAEAGRARRTLDDRWVLGELGVIDSNRSALSWTIPPGEGMESLGRSQSGSVGSSTLLKADPPLYAEVLARQAAA
jgi:Asparagine synthase